MRLDEALSEMPVVAILRGVRPDEVVAIAEALYAEGIRGVEVPLNSPSPYDSIARLAFELGSRMACGAGTVLTAQHVSEVGKAGGTIIVSPNTDPEVITQALSLGLDPAPGFATATEAFRAIAAGARHLKLFPAATYGPGHVKQLRAVLPPEITVWAVGGVGPSQMADWWSAGARAFGIGSDIYAPGRTASEVATRAREIVAAARMLVG